MWRAAVAIFALLLITAVEFEYFPGHTYLASGSELYLPMLQHLVTPTYLTRDMVATHPTVAYSIYDEVTLFLHEKSGVSLERALLFQQLLFRLAAVAGVYLLARAGGLSRALAMAAAALLNLGIFLPGLQSWLIDPDPLPRSFALGALLLSAGFLAQAKPLLSGLCGGLAFLYAPITAAPLWIVTIAALLFDRRLRKLMRPVIPIYLIFLLLFANLSQLQQGTPEIQSVLGRFSTEVAAIEQFRFPQLWLSLWPRGDLFLYPAIFVISIAGVTRIWPMLNRQMQWLSWTLPLLALLSMPVSALFVEGLHSSAVLRAQPLQALALGSFFTLLVCFLSGCWAFKKQRKAEAVAWLALCIFPVTLSLMHWSHRTRNSDISDLAAWAENNTWGSALFLFPNAGLSTSPSVFRALSRRGLWVDWESGSLISYYTDVATEWSTRWNNTMEGPDSGQHLQTMLSLPIDYYVFTRKYSVATNSDNLLQSVAPVYINRSFVVYEATALRTAPGQLEIRVSEPPKSRYLN